MLRASSRLTGKLSTTRMVGPRAGGAGLGAITRRTRRGHMLPGPEEDLHLPHERLGVDRLGQVAVEAGGEHAVPVPDHGQRGHCHQGTVRSSGSLLSQRATS